MIRWTQRVFGRRQRGLWTVVFAVAAVVGLHMGLIRITAMKARAPDEEFFGRAAPLDDASRMHEHKAGEVWC